MARSTQAQLRTRRELWGSALHLPAQASLGDDQVHLSQQSQGLFDSHTLRSQALREVRQILRQLTERLAAQSVAIEQALGLRGEVDVIVAKGRVRRQMQGTAA